MPRNNKHIEKPILVMVEGNDDQELIQRLLADLGLKERIQCWIAGSKAEMAISLSELYLQPNFRLIRKLAIIVDADNDPEQTRLTIQKYVRKATLSDEITVTIHTLPDDKPGMLEDLCIESVATDAVMPCVESFLQCIEPQVDELPRNPSKSRFLAFMASRPKATNGTVEAALQKSCFPLDHEAFSSIRSVLTGLVSN